MRLVKCFVYPQSLSVDLSRKPAQLSVAGKTLTILRADDARLVYILSELGTSPELATSSQTCDL